MEDLFSLIGEKEDLHPDLAPYLNVESFGTMLKHPLVFNLFHSPQMNAFCNKQYKEKKTYIDIALKEKDFDRYIWMHERPYRMDAFVQIMGDISDSEYWKLLGSIWADSENLWQYKHLLPILLNSKRPNRKSMMNKEEQAFLEKLPEKIVIYRGHQGRNRSGYSWTLSYSCGKWFSQRFKDKQTGIVTGTIEKQNIIAVLLGRNEFEIICDPKFILNVTPIRKLTRKPWIENVLEEAIADFPLKGNTDHGLSHWEKVEKNALRLAKDQPKCDKIVVQLFSLLHDCKRENEFKDPLHGKRAAIFAKQLFERKKLQITENQLHTLMLACELHNDGQITSDPTIGVCWDADRLDLIRVGIIPDANLLSTKAGKSLLWEI